MIEEAFSRRIHKVTEKLKEAQRSHILNIIIHYEL